ncbi:MAG: hypothetical protein LAN62_07615 [Acidobacteriia bacterium]|nr:hypothetical protein [Terriglobia bacterium]
MFPPQVPVIRPAAGGLGILVIVLALALSCAPPQPKPTGVAYEFDSAKDSFKRGRFDRTLEFCEGPSTASPPNAFTARAQVLQVVVYGGFIKADRQLADAYQKGSDANKTPRAKSAYLSLRHDNLQVASQLALALAAVAHRITQAGPIPKEVTLEAPYPTREEAKAPPELARVEEGAWVEPEDQEALARHAQFQGIEDALAEIVGGDRPKARAALGAGPVKLNGGNFAIYLGQQLLVGESIFDKKHIHDPQKSRTMLDEADAAAKAAQAFLKENPDKTAEKSLKKLQDDIKSARKNM